MRRGTSRELWTGLQKSSGNGMKPRAEKIERNIIRGLAAFGILMFLFASRAFIAFAQGPTNTDPSNMFIFDNRPHAIPANTALWYVFYYAGDKSPFQIKMADAANTGLGFRFYTWEQARRLTSQDKPLGQGAASAVSCSSGKCQSSDLTWDGSTSTEGVYIIEVTNAAPKPLVFNMTIIGTGIQLGPPLADAVPTAAPPTVPAPNVPPAPVPSATIPVQPAAPSRPGDIPDYRFDIGPYF
jgi:hypothetical protein